MKKILIPLVIFFLLAFGFMAYFYSERLDNINNRAEIAKYIAQALEEDTLHVEFHGRDFPLGSEHSYRLLENFSWGQTQRRRIWSAPDEYRDKITFFMGDLTLTVYSLDSEPQADVIEKNIGGQMRWFKLEKFNLFRRMETFVAGSDEGS